MVITFPSDYKFPEIDPTHADKIKDEIRKASSDFHHLKEKIDRWLYSYSSAFNWGEKLNNFKYEYEYIVKSIYNFYKKINQWAPKRDIVTQHRLEFELKDLSIPEVKELLFPNESFLKKNKEEKDKIRSTFETLARKFQLIVLSIVDLLVQVEEVRMLKQTPSMINVEGFDVYIDNVGVIFQHKDNKEIVDKSIAEIREAIKKIKEHGFGKALKDFKIILHFASSGAKGAYEPFVKELHMYASSDPNLSYTFCHEFSHKYYFNNMSSNARNGWAEYYRPGQATREDIANYMKDIIMPFSEELIRLSKGTRFNFQINDYKPELLRLADVYIQSKNAEAKADPKKEKKVLGTIEKKKIEIFIDIYCDFYKKLNSIYEYQQSLLNNDFLKSGVWNIESMAMEEELTQYAKTNPEEAFAESLAIYIWNGPMLLPEKTRDLLRRVVETGGVVLKYAAKERVKVFKKIIASNKMLSLYATSD